MNIDRLALQAVEQELPELFDYLHDETQRDLFLTELKQYMAWELTELQDEYDALEQNSAAIIDIPKTGLPLSSLGQLKALYEKVFSTQQIFNLDELSALHQSVSETQFKFIVNTVWQLHQNMIEN